MYGINVSKFENFQQVYEILGSYPDLKFNQEITHEHNYISSLDTICFPE